MTTVEEDVDGVLAWLLDDWKRRKAKNEGCDQRNVARGTLWRRANPHVSAHLGQYGVSIGVHHDNSNLVIRIGLGPLERELTHQRDTQWRRILVAPEDADAASQNEGFPFGDLCSVR